MLPCGSFVRRIFVCANTQVRELDLPLRFNQALVTKQFNQMREDECYFCHELLAEGKEEDRLNLLLSV